jgi:hypothetical protein
LETTLTPGSKRKKPMPENDSWKLKELTDGGVVEFVSSTYNDGRAEFTFCPVWKRGKITELFIYPRQQKRKDPAECWHIQCGFSASLTIGSWTHRGIDEPRVWMHFWCKEHKTQSCHVYVPANADCFEVRMGSSLGIYFTKKEKKDVTQRSTSTSWG